GNGVNGGLGQARGGNGGSSGANGVAGGDPGSAGGGGGGGGYGSGGGGWSAGAGGLGASNWTGASTLPAAAGIGGTAGLLRGGNAGLVILTYTSPTGVCQL
ncbi:MAG: hypothetical protein WCJ30_20620, partial [Deltaproteobacteria bacterium]